MDAVVAVVTRISVDEVDRLELGEVRASACAESAVRCEGVKRRGPWLLVLLMAGTVVMLLAALLLTQSDDEVDVAALLAATPHAVDEQGTAHLEITVEVDNESIDVSVHGVGAVDFTSSAGWFDLDLLENAVGLRTDGTTLFVLPSGETTWLAVHAEDSAALGPFGTGPSEVIAFVDLLRGYDDDIDDLGVEDIGGAETRHLRIEVDLDAAADGEDRRASIEPLRQLAPDGVLPLEVWIDDRNLPVRQRVRGTVQGVDLVVTVELTSWGDELGVPIPPEGAVRDIEPEELARIFGGAPAG